MIFMHGIGLILISLMFGLNADAATADIVAIVAARSAVNTLSQNQIADIFLGKTNHFPNGEQAIPFDQVEGSIAREEFYAKLTGKTAPQLKAYWSKLIFTGRGQPPKDFANSSEVKKHVVANPNAIGYIEKSMVDSSVKVMLAP
ncbi:phosphate ABC transporter substrate-binding protein [Glaciimonas sp. GG7]